MIDTAESLKYVGCPYCTRGHRPTWRFDANLPDGGEWVHTIQTRIDPKTTTVATTICTAGKPNAAQPPAASD